MSLSKEMSEYHLTPDGWVEGSFFGDVLGGRVIRDTPKNRVLTIGVYDLLPAPFAKSQIYDQVLWESKDRSCIDRLIEKFGNRPNTALKPTT